MVATTRDHVGSGGNISRTMGSGESSVSWSAVFAGTAGAAALSLILMLLGTAFGLAAVSPWGGAGASAAAIGIGAILWLSLTHAAASGLGGYLAGRLRVKWTSFDADEVYFRDTVHGFLTWSIATLLTAAVLGSTISAMGEQAGGETASPPAVGAMAAAADEGDGASSPRTLEYYATSLFHADGAAAPVDADTRDAATLVLERGLVFGSLEAEDRQYLSLLVADRTGVAPEQAEQRVADVYERAMAGREEMTAALDEAREAAAWTAGWMVVALLIGAFVASWAATYGGRHRDSIDQI